MNRLAMIRGDTWTHEFDELTDEDGYPRDLEDADLTFTAKARYTDSVAVITKTSADGLTVSGGVITLALDPADTEDVTAATRYVWDIQSEEDGDTVTVLRGTLDVYLDVTRG